MKPEKRARQARVLAQPSPSTALLAPEATQAADEHDAGSSAIDPNALLKMVGRSMAM